VASTYGGPPQGSIGLWLALDDNDDQRLLNVNVGRKLPAQVATTPDCHLDLLVLDDGTQYCGHLLRAPGKSSSGYILAGCFIALFAVPSGIIE
jgi:hypothetical protein